MTRTSALLLIVCYVGVCAVPQTKSTQPISLADIDADTLPSCPLSCNGHGACIPIPSSSLTRCECEANYHGPGCQFSSHPLPKAVRDAIEKSDAPLGCLNGCSGRGTCRFSDWTCQCAPGFKGEDCSIVNNDGSCAFANNCSGHGLCSFLNGMFSCTCEDGFTGVDCSTPVDLCGGCRHGLCSTSSGNPSCECFKGFAGAHCDEYVPSDDPCRSSNFCSGNGHCLEGTSVCMCDSALTSPSSHCHIAPEDAPTCPHNPSTGAICSSNGLCNLDLSCSCNPEFTGAACERSRCEHTCEPHGICVKQPNHSYLCSCDDGYTGEGCEIDTLAVTDSPCCEDDCSHQGVCHHCVCNCFDGFTGPSCAQAVPVADSDLSGLGL